MHTKILTEPYKKCMVKLPLQIPDSVLKQRSKIDHHCFRNNT